ncbi:DUF167 domain-containing protein [Patescibacteria group bacterium]|nr:DUF167 domain-containing protein [Patescibacteria group bacterium]MBU1499438.1 DUF167 domain-containing protein [Patescibacteria group bacterium]
MLINLKVHAKSSKNQVQKIDKNTYKVWVVAPATKGQANKAVIYLLAKHLNVKPNQVFIQSGLLSGNKTVKIIN